MRLRLIIIIIQLILVMGFIYPQDYRPNNKFDQVHTLWKSAHKFRKDLMDYIKANFDNRLEYDILTSFNNSCIFVQSQMLHFESYNSIREYLNPTERSYLDRILSDALDRIYSDSESEIESINNGIAYTKTNSIANIGQDLKEIIRKFLTAINE